MEKEQSLQIIEQALNVANAKGSFKLEESAAIFKALTIIKGTFEDLKQKVGVKSTEDEI